MIADYLDSHSLTSDPDTYQEAEGIWAALGGRLPRRAAPAIGTVPLPGAAPVIRRRQRALGRLYAMEAAERLSVRGVRTHLRDSLTGHRRVTVAMQQGSKSIELGDPAGPAVRRLRQHLRSESDLLPTSDVIAWIEAQYCDELDISDPKDGPKAFFAALAASQRAARGPTGNLTETLWVPGPTPPRSGTVLGHGLLGDLARCADELASAYRWAPADATSFVLTGEVPAVVRGIIRFEARGSFGNATTRVVLELDPDMTPAEVVAAFKAGRRVVAGTRQRVRRMTDGGIELGAWFAARTGLSLRRPTDTTWGDLQREWNRAHPPWRQAGTPENFKTRAEEASARLLLPWIALKRRRATRKTA